MSGILLKVHESYRWVVAVCDSNVFGRKLVDGRRVLDVSGEFFKGKDMSEDEARDEIARCVNEDATFNFVGERSVGIAKELGIVKDEGIMRVDGIPVALVLL
ncbi:DUF424 family protein [Candidatus Pacearchaeota archaeon]|nr:DUF424 family protein [Candidatus Pacearchaeota archaeon]